MSRERVIVDIETLDEAFKVEQTIKTGYCDTIFENLSQWLAVEEDLANSYQKISQKSPDPKVKKTLNELENESRNNITQIHSELETFEKLAEKRTQREKLIEHLMKKA